MTPDDFPAFAVPMASDRARFMGGPYSRAQAWVMFCADHAQWDWFGCGAMTIEDRATGAPLGQVAVNAGPLFPEHELGWMVYPQAEGQGVAFEPASALRDWARDDRCLPTLVSYIDTGNNRSIALAQRLGAWSDAMALRPGPDDLVYRHFG